MKPQADVTDAAGLTDLLRTSEAASRSLDRARMKIMELVQAGRSRPAWQPQCTRLVCDERLVDRLDSTADRIEEGRKHLIDRQKELLRDAQLRSAFACPSELKERIDYLNLIYSHARYRKLREVVRILPTPAGMSLDKKFREPFLALAKFGYDPEKAARERATAWADEGNEYWWTQYYKAKNEQARLWRTILDLLQRNLDIAFSERRVQKERHDDSLTREFMPLLTPHIAQLREAMAVSQGIITEVQAANERETASIEGVRAIWLGTQHAERYANRAGAIMDDVDKSLAADWARHHQGSPFWIGAMKSARRAELVALRLYQEIYGDSKDLSILQNRDPSDEQWKIADIETGGRWIDVKNACRSLSSRESYSEHLVKKFKEYQPNCEVVVSGFLSPYHKEPNLEMTDEVFVDPCPVETTEKVVWLGETTEGAINRLKGQFETDYLKLDLSVFETDYLKPDRSVKGAKRIPPWLFDYPPECYAQRDAALSCGRSPDFILPRSDCPLGFLTLVGRVEQSFPECRLSEEALAINRRIAAGATLTRPMLFLHIMDRFCRSTREKAPFPANDLRQILFPATSPFLAECSTPTTPLAVLDPLETVKELLDVLEKVANTCAQRAIAFTTFRLAGRGVFQGRWNGENWQTIFAYCGGWRTKPIGKCGQSPLFLGQNNSCEICSKLVCHTCGYCSETCQHCLPRQISFRTS
jgi:hypothetical protein